MLLLVSIVIVLVALLSIRFMLLLQMERDRKEVGMLKALGGRLIAGPLAGSLSET